MASEPDLISGLQAALEEDREPPADVLAGLPAEAVTELRTLNERADTKALHERLMSLGMSKMGQRAKAIKQLQAMPPLPPSPAAPSVEIKKGFFSAVRIARGAKVRIQGLKSRPELNGKEGTVKSFDKETGRYKVVLSAEDGGGALALKPEALQELRSSTPPPLADISDAESALAGLSIHPPLRCPPSLLTEHLPRLPDVSSLSSVKAIKKMLLDGKAFAAPAKDIVGAGMLRWDFDYLLKNLPTEQKFDVFYVRDRLVMSHSIRYGDAATAAGSAAAASSAAGATGTCGGDTAPFAQSELAALTFAEFLAASKGASMAASKAASTDGGEGSTRPAGTPYLGLDVFKRTSKQDQAGRHGPIGDTLVKDMLQFDFCALMDWSFPVISAMHLFVGTAGTCYHTHYDLNPNLHFQLVGRKRFILFPPNQWRNLYPFPCHHDLDRRSRLDLDAPDDERFPRWQKAKGMAVELGPGDCLYIPPFWFHHVQTVTTPCVSMAVWCYDTHPNSVSGGRDLMPSSAAAKLIAEAKAKESAEAVEEQVELIGRDVLRGTVPNAERDTCHSELASIGVELASAAKKKTKDGSPSVSNCFGGHFYGLCTAGAELSLVRYVEQLFGQMIVMPELHARGGSAGDGAGRKAADSGEAYAGPAKERAVAGWLRRTGDVSAVVAKWTASPGEMHPITKLARMTAEEEQAEQKRLGLQPLKVPFCQLMTELYTLLQSDLADHVGDDPTAVAPFLVSVTDQSRFD